jgi:hypothetical protein
MVEIARRQLGQLGGEGDGGDMRCLEEGVVIGQLVHLRLGHFAQFAAAIADIDTPQPRHPVDDPVALGVGQPHPLGRFHDPRAFAGQRGVLGERVHVVGGVQRLQFRRRHVVGNLVHGILQTSPIPGMAHNMIKFLPPQEI